MKRKATKTILAVLIVWLVLGVFVMGAMAQGEEPPVQPAEGSIEAFLLKLAGGAGLGILFSFLAEEITWFQKLKPDQKKWAFRGIAIFVPILATALLQNVPQYMWDFLNPYWGAMVMGLAVLGAGLGTHKAQKATNTDASGRRGRVWRMAGAELPVDFPDETEVSDAFRDKPDKA